MIRYCSHPTSLELSGLLWLGLEKLEVGARAAASYPFSTQNVRCEAVFGCGLCVVAFPTSLLFPLHPPTLKEEITKIRLSFKHHTPTMFSKLFTNTGKAGARFWRRPKVQSVGAYRPMDPAYSRLPSDGLSA